MRQRYLVVLEQASDGGYGAYSPDVPGCIGMGRTSAEALESFRESLALWVEETIKEGLPLPEATSRAEYVEVAGVA